MREPQRNEKRSPADDGSEEESCCTQLHPQKRTRHLEAAPWGAQATTAEDWYVFTDQLEHWRSQEARLHPSRAAWSIQDVVTPIMRRVLVAGLMEVAEELHFSCETCLLAIALMDRYLSVCKVTANELQLLGITCLWIAAKYEEVLSPSIQYFCNIWKDTYSPRQMVRMEARILGALGFEIGCPTASTFFECYRTMANIQCPPVDLLVQHLLEVATLAAYGCSALEAAHQPNIHAPQDPVMIPHTHRPAAALEPKPDLKPGAINSSRTKALALGLADLAASVPSSPLLSGPSASSSSSQLHFSLSASNCCSPEPGPEVMSRAKHSQDKSPSPLPRGAGSAASGDVLFPSPLPTAAGAAASGALISHAPKLSVSAEEADNFCGLAYAKPSHVACAAFHVALVAHHLHSQQLLQALADMAQCSTTYVVQLSQMLLRLHFLVTHLPACHRLLDRYQTKVLAMEEQQQASQLEDPGHLCMLAACSAKPRMARGLSPQAAVAAGHSNPAMQGVEKV